MSNSMFCIWLMLAILFSLSTFTAGQIEIPEIRITPKDSSDATDDKKDSKSKKSKGKAFADVVEEFEKIEGLFTFYQNAEEGKVFVEIRPQQLEKIYLLNITREGGDGTLFDGGAMLGQFPFFFKRVGKNIQMIEKNLRFRAAEGSAVNRALARDISNSIQASAKIEGLPHPETAGVLVDAANFFLLDIGDVGEQTGRSKMSYSLDKGNSYFSKIKSFPQNSEIQVTLYFKSSKSQPIFTLADSRSMTHRYHYSLAAPPETGYKPRIGDDRVGHFQTIYQDYTSVLRNDPYVRYIQRWHLVKAEPRFKKSPPRQPIIYWIENTVPVEFRDAIREGALLWNSAFEKVGFTNAIEVRQMPDDADWDPADARYNTIRWIVQPGGAYAVGPSRANPFTGEIYDADIRLSADIIRYEYNEFTETVLPAARGKVRPETLFPWINPDFPAANSPVMPGQCAFAGGLAHQLQFGYNLATLRANRSGTAIDIEQFTHDALVNLVAHEVGHTLGLRHNFKASTLHDLANMHQAAFTDKNALTGSVMDYVPVNVSPKGTPQGSYFQTTLGAYDFWAIEYAYTPYDASGPQSETAMLEKIASKVSQPELRYGTDEDAFGLSTRSMDPTCNLWDMGSEPLDFYAQRIDLTRELWDNLLKDFEKKGSEYTRIREVFNNGIAEYMLAGLTVSKYIGGIYHYRDHIGDPGDRAPLQVVPAEKQRRALAFLVDTFFSPHSIQFPPELLNKLAPDRKMDFEGTVFRTNRLDYPVHGIVQLLQAVTMFRIYDALVLQRVQDNELRFKKGAAFNMAEVFATLRTAIWQELGGSTPINSFRRELQRMHLAELIEMILDQPPMLPHDAITLARADLQAIAGDIDRYLAAAPPEVYTAAHLEETRARITAALQAQMLKRH